jgi:hypothetical protein
VRELSVRAVRWIADEHVVDDVQPGAQALFGRLEHMFGSVERGADGTVGARAVG